MKFIKRFAIFFGLYFCCCLIGYLIFPVDENNNSQPPDWFLVAGFSISLFFTALIARDNSKQKLGFVFRVEVFFSTLFLLMAIAAMMFQKNGAGDIDIPMWYALVSITLSILSAVFYGRFPKLKAKNRSIEIAFSAIKEKISEKRKQKEFDSLSESEQWKIQRNLQERQYQGNVAAPECSEPKIMLDPMEDLAVKTFFEIGQVSVSMLQRRLKLGYTRAASIIDHLEELGIVGPFMGSAPRTILISEKQYRDHVCVTDDTREVLQDDPPIDYNKIIEDEEEWRREQTGLSDVDYEMAKVDYMEGHAFEYWCAELLRKNGFESVEVTQGSGDQGVDVLARKDGIKYAIQCKCYSKDLGNKPVQEVNTGKMVYHCQIGAVMTNRYFTQGGKDAADATGVLLWDRDKLVEMLSKKT